MGYLLKPDDRTQAALKRSRPDADFQEISAWLEASLNALDKTKRSTMDAVLLRHQQGAALLLAEIVEHVYGRPPQRALSRPIPEKAGSGGEDL